MKRKLRNAGLLAIIPMLIMTIVVIPDDVFAYEQSGILEETRNTFFFRGDLTAPEGEKLYGGEKTGNFFVQVNSNQVKIIANIGSDSIKHKILEGWLFDFGENQNIYLGIFNENMKLTKTIQIDEWKYEAIIITEKSDNEQSQLSVVAGSLLEKNTRYKSTKSF